MLTPEQIAKRRYSIGSSDAPSVCGANPWRSAYDVWLEKTGRVEPFAGNEATRAGDLLEPAIIQYAIETLKPLHAKRGVELVSEDHDFITATLDAEFWFNLEDCCIVEGKSGGVCSPLDYDAWGEPETDEIPEYYMVQVQHQMFVAGKRYQFAAVPSLLPPRGFMMYYVPRDEALIEAIVERELKFWEHVKSDTPPDGTPSMDALKRMRRQPKKTVPIDESLILAWNDAKEKANQAKQVKEEAEIALLASLGDAEAGDFGGGQLITYMETSRRAYSVGATKYRSLKIKKVKK